MRIRNRSVEQPSEDLTQYLPPVATGEVDLLGLIRRWMTEGTPPPDPDRRLATQSPAPPERALPMLRAHVLGEAARAAANEQGEAESEPLRKRASELTQQAAERQPQIESKQARKADIEEKQQFYSNELRQLAYRPMGRNENIRYYATQALLALADVGNIAAASVNVLGDPLPLAVIQGLGVGVANVTVGQLGAEVRERRERAKRPEKPPKDGDAFEIFYGDDNGESMSNWALGLGGLAVGLTAIGQFAWRSVFDGAPIGLVYAAFAVVVVVGSFVNSYIHGGLDGVQRYKDDLDPESAQLTTEIADLKQPEAEAAGLQAQIDTIMRAHTAQGEAIAKLAIAEAYTLMIQNPNLYGTHDAQIRVVLDEELDEDLDQASDDDSEVVDTATLSDPHADPFTIRGDGKEEAA